MDLGEYLPQMIAAAIVAAVGVRHQLKPTVEKAVREVLEKELPQIVRSAVREAVNAELTTIIRNVVQVETAQSAARLNRLESEMMAVFSKTGLKRRGEDVA